MQSEYSGIKELEALTDIVQSTDWRAYVRLLELHSQWLQKQVNICLRKHEDRLACEWLAKMDECDRMADIMKNRIKQLHEQQGEK